MSPDEQLGAALLTLGLPVSPGVDTTTEGEYIVYSYVSDGELWGDDAPCIDHRIWAVVYAAPLDLNRLSMRNAIRNVIFDLFGAWPSEDPETTAVGQQYLYEFETVGGL